MIADRAAIDPDLQAALTIQELAAEREHIMSALQQRELALKQMQAQTAQAQQQIQMLSAQNQQTQQAADMASQQALQHAAARQQAESQVIQAKDQNLQDQLITQQMREQMSSMADQLKSQLDQVKQVVAQSPMQIAQSQQQQQMMAQQQQQQQATVDPTAPPEVQKQQMEATKAQQDAAMQQQQVQQQAGAEQAKQQMAVQQQVVKQQAAAQGQKVAALRRALMKTASVESYKSPKEQPADNSDKIRTALKKIIEEKEKGGVVTVDNMLNKTAGFFTRDRIIQIASPIAGGLIGAGVGGIQASRIDASKPSQNETYLKFRAIAAKKVSEDDPTYANKIKAVAALSDYNVEKANREHPGGRAVYRGLQGAALGGLTGASAAYITNVIANRLKQGKVAR